MIKKEQYKLELYKPTGEYAGLLDVFNLNANLNIEGYSTISFNIAAYIDAEENMRLFEVLDLYEVVLTIYNKKYRFILRSIPVSFDDSGPRYTYEGISTESELDKKIIADWIGVKRDIDFYHYKFKTPGSGNYPAVPGGHTVIELPDPHPEIVNLDKVAEIIEVFEVREDDDLFRQTPLIYKDDVEYNSGKGVFFKRGTYHLQRNGSNLKIIIAKYEEKDLYGTTNAERLLSDELGIYYNIYLNPPFDFSEDGETGLLLISEAAENAIYEPMTAYSHEETYNVEYYSKMGVTIEDILLDNLYKATNGIWTFDFKGVSAAKIAEIKRGDFEFNNISIYSILEEIRNSYDVVYLVDTYERNITFYKKHEEYNPEIINSIVLGEGAYLKSIEKTLDTNEVATNIYGLGKDYISTSLFSPTVSWFDYSYYLDGAWTLADSAWKDNNGDLIPSDVLFNFVNDGFNLWPTSKTDEIESKWMPKDMALIVAEWQILRDIIVDIYLGKIRPSDYALNASTRRYKLLNAAYNMIEKREDAIEELTKLETQLISQEAEYKNYKALADFSLRQSERIGLSPEEEEEYESRYQNFLKISEGLFDGIEEKKNRIKDMENQLFETNLTDEWESPEKDYFTYVFLAIQEEMKNHLESGIGSNGAKTLQKFTFDYLLQDDTVITTKDLLEKVKEYAAENSKPKVSLNVDIIDILAAHDIPEEDRESLFVGNYLYVNFPMFNVDEKAQIKSMSIDFDSNSVSLEISTVERYATGLLQKMVKNLRHLGTNYMNVGKYKEDETKKFKNAAKTSETIIDGNILEYKNIENEEETIVIDNHTMTFGSVDIDHNKQAIVRISREDRIEIGSGSIFLEKINTTMEDDVITDTRGVQVITSLDEGFVIKQVAGWDNEKEKKKLKRIFQATEGGNLYVEGTVEANEGRIGKWLIGDGLYAGGSGQQVIIKPPTQGEEGEEGDDNVILIGGSTWNESNFAVDKYGRVKLALDGGDITDLFVFDPENEVENGNGQHLVVEGKITAHEGAIANWIIKPNHLHNQSDINDNSTYVGLRSREFYSGVTDDSVMYAFIAGGVDANAPFWINYEGKLKATGAEIEGHIEANTGYIGQWSLNNKRLVSTGENFILDGNESSPFAIQVKKKINGIDTNIFTITHEGDLYALSASVKGEIKADEGYIGNWSLLNNTLVSSGEKVVLDGNEDAEYSIDVNKLFTVKPSGYMESTSGKIGGWTIDANKLYSKVAEQGFIKLSNSGDVIVAGQMTGTEEGESRFILTHDGHLTSKSGNIGGWNILPGKLVGGMNGYTIGLYSTENNDELAFAIGTQTWAGATFAIKQDGNFKYRTVTNQKTYELTSQIERDGNIVDVLQFKGRLEVDEGNIAGWEIGTESLSKGTPELESFISLVHNGLTDGTFMGGFTAGRNSFYDETVSGGDVGKGIYLGIGKVFHDGIAKYKPVLSIKSYESGSTDSLLWNGKKLNIEGVINAREGYIGNWTIKDGELYSQRGGSSNFVRIAPALVGESTKRVLEMSSGGVSNFYVQGDGTIFSQKGSIAGWNIDPNALKKEGNFYVGLHSGDYPSLRIVRDDIYTDTGSYNSSLSKYEIVKDDKDGIYIGKGKVWDNFDDGAVWEEYQREVIFAKGKNGFFRWDGRNLEMSGVIRAKGGSLGGWRIRGDRLYSLNDNDYVGIHTPNYSKTIKDKDEYNNPITTAFLAGGDNWKDAHFGVSFDGKMKATKGTIGGWSIEEDSLATVLENDEHAGYVTYYATSNSNRVFTTNFPYSRINEIEVYYGDLQLLNRNEVPSALSEEVTWSSNSYKILVGEETLEELFRFSNSGGNVRVTISQTSGISFPISLKIGISNSHKTGYVKLSSSFEEGYAIVAGHEDPSLAGFTVDKLGLMEATGAKIGAWNIGDARIYSSHGPSHFLFQSRFAPGTDLSQVISLGVLHDLSPAAFEVSGIGQLYSRGAFLVEPFLQEPLISIDQGNILLGDTGLTAGLIVGKSGRNLSTEILYDRVKSNRVETETVSIDGVNIKKDGGANSARFLVNGYSVTQSSNPGKMTVDVSVTKELNSATSISIAVYYKYNRAFDTRTRTHTTSVTFPRYTSTYTFTLNDLGLNFGTSISEIYSVTISPTTTTNVSQSGSGITVSGGVSPSIDDYYILGDGSKYWKQINGYTINEVSDLNLKKDIVYNLDKYDRFFDNLKPVYYKMKNGTSGRDHVGFISQEIGQTLIESGLTTQEFAGYVRDVHETEGERYSLRYSQFHAITIDQVQKLKKRVSDLEEVIQQLLTQLNN